MATTTNFGWETPDDTDLVKDGAAAMRTLGNSIDSSFIDLKGGTTGQILSKASNTDLDYSWITQNAQITPINPNIIINGNFTINQRSYVSGTNLASGSYGFDRWKSGFTNTSLTFTSAPAGQSVTINTNGVITQIVEQSNVDPGTYTLSWTGTATGRIYNAGGTPSSYAASPITFTADGLANVVVEFTATGSTKTLSKVKLEKGSNATNYSYSGGTIQGELAACQRYYYLAAGGATQLFIGSASFYTATEADTMLNFPVTMRAVPTLVATSGTNYYATNRNGSSSTYNSLTIYGASQNGSMMYNTSASGTAGHAGTTYTNNAAASVAFSAEL